MPNQSYENTLERHHLLKNIPTFPYGDPKDRHAVSYDDYVKNGGYEGLRKAISMKPSEIIDEVKASVLRGRGGPSHASARERRR